MLLLTLLTVTSWAETEVAKKEETTTHVDETKKEHHAKSHHAKHKKDKHHHGKAKTCRSDHDVDGKHLTKYTVAGLKALHGLLQAAIERNEARDPEDLENRLAYQKKRGGKTPCGASYAGLSMTHFLNVIEDETREMEADMKDIEKELESRGHKCSGKSR